MRVIEIDASQSQHGHWLCGSDSAMRGVVQCVNSDWRGRAFCLFKNGAEDGKICSMSFGECDLFGRVA